jgi:hypothetical protein
MSKSPEDGCFYWTHPLSGRRFNLGDNFVKARAESMSANIVLQDRARQANGVVSSSGGGWRLEDILLASVDVSSAWCGVYFLIKDKEVVYVGMSTNVGGRLREHRRDKSKTFDKFSYMPCPADEAARLEVHYIETLKPRYNLKDNPEAPKKPKYQPTKRERFYRAARANPPGVKVTAP